LHRPHQKFFAGVSVLNNCFRMDQPCFYVFDCGKQDCGEGKD
jgi:hypothetical protein